MHFVPFRSFTALAFAAALFGIASSVDAGPKDKEAQKLLSEAIDTDYLNMEYAKAEKKLKEAVTMCGGGGCTPELLGKINVALGTVYGVGLSKHDDAKSAFIAALKADGKAALDPALTTPELQKIFDEAKKAPGSKDPGTKVTSSDSNHTPPSESVVSTPLPVYIEPPDELPLSKVTLRYKPFGATQYKSIEMRKLGRGFGVEIPCEDVSTTGDIKYFFAFTGTDGEPAGGHGTIKEPFRTTIKNDIEGEAPRLPGAKPPKKCKEKGDCPPGLPGCPDVKKHGVKGWGSSCDAPSECKEGLTCLNGTCEEDTGGGGGGKGGKKKRMNMVSVGVELDLLLISGAKNVCDGTNASYACFHDGTSHQFFGDPYTNADGSPWKTTDGIQGGFGLGGARFMVGYDRQLTRNIALTLGLRLGIAVGGSPSPDNLDADGNPNVETSIPAARSFLPVHAEARFGYAFLGSMLEDKKFRPYVFIAGGLAQVNAGVPVVVCDRVHVDGESTKGCPDNVSMRQVKAYQITGLNFAGFGAGTTFGITPYFGVGLELKVMFMVPTFGVVFAPTLSPVFAF